MPTRYLGSTRCCGSTSVRREIAGLPGTAHVILESPGSAGRMVDDGVVLHADRAALVAALSAADLCTPQRRALGTREVREPLRDAGAQHAHRDLPVRVLRALGLAAHRDARRQVHDMD